MTVTSQGEQNPAYRPTPFLLRHRAAVDIDGGAFFCGFADGARLFALRVTANGEFSPVPGLTRQGVWITTFEI